MTARKFLSLFLAFLALLLSACTGASGAKQIAAAPRLTPIASYPEGITIVYQGYIELQVSEVDAAMQSAAGLAQRNGGYFTGSQSWYVDGRKVATLELAVPTPNFDRLRQSIIGLGVLVNETVGSRPVYPPSPYSDPYSSLTVHLRPGDTLVYLPEPPSTGWDPLNTLRRAFAVFLTIFGFLANVVIWIVVVAGPFLLLGGIAYLVIRRLRRRGP